MTAISSEWKVDNGGSHLTLVTLLVLRKTKQYQVLIQVYTHTDTHTGTRNLCWFLKYISSGMKEHPDVNLVVSWFFQTSDLLVLYHKPNTQHLQFTSLKRYTLWSPSLKKTYFKFPDTNFVDYRKFSCQGPKLRDTCKLTLWIQIFTLLLVLAKLNLGENTN